VKSKHYKFDYFHKPIDTDGSARRPWERTSTIVEEEELQRIRDYNSARITLYAIAWRETDTGEASALDELVYVHTDSIEKTVAFCHSLPKHSTANERRKTKNEKITQTETDATESDDQQSDELTTKSPIIQE
jgi:hypothetical protein